MPMIMHPAKILAFTAGIFFSVFLHAQLSSKEMAKVEQSKALYNQEKYDKAVSKLEPVLLKHETSGELWMLMIHYRKARYELQEEKEKQKMVKDLTNALTRGKSATIYVDNSLSKRYMGEYLGSCRRATLCADNQVMASIILRSVYIDEPVDTAIKEDAVKKFNEAEKEFAAENYHKAAGLYREALAIDSTYYKAGLYLGDSYWKDRQPEQAVRYYKRAAETHPHQLEPHKYLADAYYTMNEYEKSYAECIEALLIHPDVDMFNKLSKAAAQLGHSFDRHWMSRMYSTNDPEINQGPIAELPWNYYREAKSLIAPFCNSKGIIEKTNTLTKEKYMEAFCWEYMLSRTSDNPGEFEFARKMQKAGQLDCFVLLSMYHIGVNDQYTHLVKANPEKLREYIRNYLVQ